MVNYGLFFFPKAFRLLEYPPCLTGDAYIFYAQLWLLLGES